MKAHRITALLACGALAVGVAACGDDNDDDSTNAGATTGQSAGADTGSLSGAIRIDGSSTVQPVAEAGAELFQEQAPDVQISVGGAGTGDGFKRFCRGEIVIADASRPIEKDEYDACKAKGIEPVEVQVGTDGLSVVAHKDLAIPNDCITTANLKKLLAPKSKVTNYKELGPGYPDTPVQFFTPGTESGTYDFFTETVLETDAEQRTDKVQTSADDNQIVTGITGTEGALGYVGFAFADENKDKLKILKVDGGEGCVEPTLETIASGEYKPLSRPLFMYPSTKTAAQPEVKAFLQFINENNEEVIKAADYIALPDDLKAKAAETIENPTPVAAPAT